MLDAKSGYHNVKVHPNTQPYLGVITQDGLYVFVRMPFGLSKAPDHFQFVMDGILEKVPGQPAISYQDDVLVPGKDGWEELWEDTKAVIRAMTEAGLMLNLNKCKLLIPQPKLLGLELAYDGYRLHGKSLKAWVDVKIPTNLKELQSLVGKLMWASPFIPNFKTLIKPIEGLLGGKEEVKWTRQCTEAVNLLVEQIFKRYAL